MLIFFKKTGDNIMNKLLTLLLMLTVSLAHASCGELEIKVVNNTSRNCVLRNKLVYYGNLPNEQVPSAIGPLQSSPFFYANQDKLGIGVILAYTCSGDKDKEEVKLYSWQNYCSFFSGAGLVGGRPWSNALNVEYETKTGSLITGRPGQIIWRIS